MSTIEFIESAKIQYRKEICLLKRRVLCRILKREWTENKCHLPLCLSICLTAFISPTLWLSLWPYPYPCLSLTLFLSLHISLSLFIFIFLSRFLFLIFSHSSYFSLSLSLFLFIFLFPFIIVFFSFHISYFLSL